MQPFQASAFPGAMQGMIAVWFDDFRGRLKPSRRKSLAPLLSMLVLTAWLGSAAEPPPDFLWSAEAGGSDTDAGYSIAADASGNVYVTGFFSGTASFGNTNLSSGGLEDIFVAKYDAAGYLQWVRQAGGSAFDEGHGIAVDGTGNVFVTGFFQGNASFGPTNLGSTGQSDVFVAKYDSAGNLVWVSQAGSRDYDEANAIALDNAGNVYVTGYFDANARFGSSVLANSSASDDIFVAKCDIAGHFLWARSAGGASDDAGNGIAVDAANNVYVTGAFAGPATFAGTNLTGAGTNGSSDIFVAKYDSSGSLLRVRQAGGTNEDRGDAIAADAAGNAYVTGKIFGAAAFGNTNLIGRGVDMFLAKYDTAGSLLWARVAGGNNSIDGDGGFGVTLDPSGNPCVAGYFSGIASFGPANVPTAGLDDIFVGKYDDSGNLLWVRQAGGSDLDVGYAIAGDAAGNLYLTGFFVATAAFGSTNLMASSPSPDRDIFVTKLGLVTPPKLRISRAGGDLLLSWPAAASGFHVELSDHLPAINWVDLSTNSQLVGPSNILTLSPTMPQNFFRLRK